jgi:hypothetical protein
MTYDFINVNATKELVTSNSRMLKRKYFSKVTASDLISVVKNDFKHSLLQQLNSDIDFFKK